MTVNKKSILSNNPVEKQERMFVKVDDGRWYAIPASMEESFRKVGAQIGFLNDGTNCCGEFDDWEEF